MDKIYLFFTIYISITIGTLTSIIIYPKEYNSCINDINYLQHDKYLINKYSICVKRNIQNNIMTATIYSDYQNQTNVMEEIQFPATLDVVIKHELFNHNMFIYFNIMFDNSSIGNHLLLFIPAIATIIILILNHIIYKLHKLRGYNIFIVIENNNLECPICYEVMNGRVSMTKCKHKFHISCLNEWLENAEYINCPICRTSL